MFKNIAIPITLLTFILFTASCNQEDNNCADNFNFALELENEFNALNEAAATYSQDPTPENCNAYKTAVNDYLDAAEDLKSCAQIVGQGTIFQESIDNTKAAIEDLECG